MKKFIWALAAVMMISMAAGCSGDEDKKEASAASEVKNPIETQVNALDSAATLTRDLSAQQQANRAEVDKMFEE